MDLGRIRSVWNPTYLGFFWKTRNNLRVLNCEKSGSQPNWRLKVGKKKSLNWNWGLFQIYKKRLKLRPKVLLKSKKLTPLYVPTFSIGIPLTWSSYYLRSVPVLGRYHILWYLLDPVLIKQLIKRSGYHFSP